MATWVYHRETTISQRKLMVEMRKEGNKLKEIASACHCDIQTVRRWCRKYDEKRGDKSLKSKSHAPMNPRRTPKEIRDKIVKMKKEHKEWGDKRIAGEILKASIGISNGTVYNILQGEGFYPLKKTTTIR